MKILVCMFLCFFSTAAFSQNKVISGIISFESKTAESITITLNEGQKVATSDAHGYYKFDKLSVGLYEITVSGMAYRSAK